VVERAIESAQDAFVDGSMSFVQLLFTKGRRTYQRALQNCSKPAFMALTICLSTCCLGAWRDSAAGDITDEATAEADRVIKSAILRLPDGTSISRTFSRMELSSKWFADYWQYSSFTWTLVSEPLTRADQLNGITWKGTINSKIDAWRSLHDDAHFREDSHPCWQSWRDMPPDKNFKWSLQKINGQWKFYRIDDPSLVPAPMGDEAPKQQDAEGALKRPNCNF
jgi:hypothetical protein